MSKFTPYPKSEPTPKKLFNSSGIKKRPRVTGELVLFRRIVMKRGSKSEINGEPIHDITVSSMMHILAKGQNQYPEFKLYEKNIMIVTPDQHREWDQGSQEELRKLPEWKKVFDLREELLEEYNQLYP